MCGRSPFCLLNSLTSMLRSCVRIGRFASSGSMSMKGRLRPPEPSPVEGGGDIFEKFQICLVLQDYNNHEDRVIEADRPALLASLSAFCYFLLSHGGMGYTKSPVATALGHKRTNFSFPVFLSFCTCVTVKGIWSCFPVDSIS